MLGRRIFRALLQAETESLQRLSQLDIVRKMTKRGLVDESEWHRWRHIRNEFSHDYPEDSQDIIAAY